MKTATAILMAVLAAGLARPEEPKTVTVPVREWLTCGPWGAATLKDRPAEAQVGDPAPWLFVRQALLKAKYPPDDRTIDLKAAWNDANTLDLNGQKQTAKWQKATAGENGQVQAFGQFASGYGVVWIQVPDAMELGVGFGTNEGALGGSWGWLNDTELPTEPGVYGGRELPRQTKLKFNKGWNRIFIRGYSIWHPVVFAMTLSGPEDALWKVKTSAEQPKAE